MFAEEIRRQAEIAPQAALPTVTAALWRAYSEGKITEAEAEALSGLIEARTDAPASRRFPWPRQLPLTKAIARPLRSRSVS